MASKILGIFADVIALLLMWVDGNSLHIWLRVVLSLVFLGIAICIYFFEQGPYKVKVIDYYHKEDKLHVFMRKNPRFTENSLVSIYYNQPY